METGAMSRYEALKEYLARLDSVAVAFSGGVNSTLLTRVAHDVLGDSMVAVTVSLRSVADAEIERARAWCTNEGIAHHIVDVNELTAVAGFADNPPDRCYLCKRHVFSMLRDLSTDLGMSAVADGSNVDDSSDYRPGMRALKELGILSPLADCGLTKADIRVLSQTLSLPTWNMPSAACLSSRFAYGDRITEEKLRRVEAAETYLHAQGFPQVRVRIHGEGGSIARIEVSQADIASLAQDPLRGEVTRHLRNLGFVYVSLDLAGFRSGAMNEVLSVQGPKDARAR